MTQPHEIRIPRLGKTWVDHAREDFEASCGEIRPRTETIEEERERKARELWEKWGLEV